MAQSFKKTYTAIQASFNKFDQESLALKSQALRSITKNLKGKASQMEQLLHWVLFIAAHASSETEQKQAEKALTYLAANLKQQKQTKSFANTGLPFTAIQSTFSFICNQWLIKHKGISIKGVELTNEYSLNNVLKHTLPALEVIHTTAGYTNLQLLEALGVSPQNNLNFLMEQIQKLGHLPFLADQLWDQIGLQTKLQVTNTQSSILFNRYSLGAYFFHKHLEKKTELTTNVNMPVSPYLLNVDERSRLANTIKQSLVLMARETDPATYMDEQSLTYFKLDRGIGIALYTMQPERQLPLESYIGYTLFKNGYPAAYGGAWVFGKRALFGINISPWFRGGESTNMIVQLLRVYHQYMEVSYIEVEPYQYGLDNPEGITTGAFWFYYRLGFRPTDKNLQKLAAAEFEKMRVNPAYRSSKRTLMQFTHSNIALQLKEQKVPMSVYDLSIKVQKKLNSIAKDNRTKAVKWLVNNWMEQEVIRSTNKSMLQTIEDLVLMASVLPKRAITQSEIIDLAKRKQTDWHAYQHALLKVLARVEA
jgi:hypothetical protein